MNGPEIARMIRGHFAKVAGELEKHDEDLIPKGTVVSALRDPWVCTLSIDDPGIWRWYNPDTGEWGDECNPS